MNQIHTSLDPLLAYHCLPALAGIKPSNLVSFPCGGIRELEAAIDQYNLHANPKGIYFHILCRCNSRALIFVYRPGLLSKSLSRPQTAAMLSRFGYDAGAGLGDMISRLGSRITPGGDFPHEIGLFLGYPCEDVEGFIANRGQDFKLCGYWKVYSDVAGARKLFDKYTRCRDWFSRQIRGASILELLGVNINKSKSAA